MNISPRYAIRLADLHNWHVVTATCLLCRRRATVALASLTRGRPGHTRLIDLERRLRCAACGNRHGNTLEVSRKPRN